MPQLRKQLGLLVEKAGQPNETAAGSLPAAVSFDHFNQELYPAVIAAARSRRSANAIVLKYRSPVSGRITTIILP